MIDKDLISILMCACCQGELEEKDGKIVCKNCAVSFPVVNGVPVIIKEEVILKNK